MNRLLPTVLLSILALCTPLGIACDTAETEELPDVSWDPEIPEGENMAILDLGQIAMGTGGVTAEISGTNNTEETLSFEVECDVFENGGFLVPSCPNVPQEIGPGESITQSATITPSDTQDYEGTFRFRYNNELVYFIIRYEAI